MARRQHAYIALAILVVLAVAVQAVASKMPGDPTFRTFNGTPQIITPEVRAAGLRISEDVAPGDRAWILAAVASARPEAQALIAEVDGLVEIDTSLHAPGAGVAGSPERAIGLARMTEEGVVVSLDARRLDGDRALDRNVVVMHELGHAIDYLLIPDPLIKQLDAGIPTVGTCTEWSAEPTGACTAVVERFADTFAKWALGGRVSLAGSGYGIPAPASLEDWGRPLGRLAMQLTLAARD